MKRSRLSIIVVGAVLGVGSLAAVSAASVADDSHPSNPEVPVDTTPFTMPNGEMDVGGTDANGNPVTVHVDDLADWRARAQAKSDELLADEPDNVYYTFVTDEYGEPKPHARCVVGAAPEEQKAEMRAAGLPAESADMLPLCELVDSVSR